jgi:hypothetical protein
MKTCKIDNNGDWTLLIVKDDLAIIQNLETRLKMIRNDCFFDLEAGMSLSSFDIGTQEILKDEIESIILNTDDVLSLNELSITLTDKRELMLKFNISIINNQSLDLDINI